MKVRVKASTKIDYQAPMKDMDTLAGNMAGICYMTGDYDTLNNEDEEKTTKRAIRTKNDGHHSVYGHGNVSLIIENVPKLFAMLLNNEQDFDTSEKSARYTTMQFEGREKALYDKWKMKFEEMIKRKYGDQPYFNDNRISKLADENARYITSVMTPTTFGHTLSICQLNYICHWLEKMPDREDAISKLLAPTGLEFVQHIKDLGYYDSALIDGENRYFSMIGRRVRREAFDETYSINYEVSLATYAQLERHRTLTYEMMFLNDKKFYLPEILLDDDKLQIEWMKDMESVANVIPQGEIVAVNERGCYEKLISKAQKRLCTAAQLEVMRNVNGVINKFIQNTDNEIIKEELMRVANKSRCASGFKCNRPCQFKEGIDLTRDI